MANLGAAEVEHRLDRDGHPGFEARPGATATGVRDVRVVRPPRTVGAGHARFVLEQDGARLQAIGFGMAERVRDLDLPRNRLDVVFHLLENRWSGRLQARLIDARLHGRPLPAFRYRNLGNLATIGRSAAVADLGRLRFGGAVAWILWLFIHLMNLVSFRNRVLVLVQWAWSYITYDRSARLITETRCE